MGITHKLKDCYQGGLVYILNNFHKDYAVKCNSVIIALLELQKAVKIWQN